MLQITAKKGATSKKVYAVFAELTEDGITVHMPLFAGAMNKVRIPADDIESIEILSPIDAVKVIYLSSLHFKPDAC